MNPITSHAIAITVGGAIVAGVCAYRSLTPNLQSVLATPSKDIAKVDKQTLKCKDVIVYVDRAKKKLDLPESVRIDPTQKVLAATQVNASDRPVTVSAVLDIGSGVTNMYVRPDPLPWLSFDTKRELGIAYGFTDSGTTARLFGKVDLIQIKMLRGGIQATVDSDGSWFAGVGLSVRW